MKKKLIAVVSNLLGIIIAFGIIDYRYSLGERYLLEESPLEEEISIESFSTSPIEEMEKVYASLGQGFNIGNSLDACDWTYFGSSNNSGFQAAIVYNSDPWTAWDASDYLSFDDDGKATIVWNLSGIQSDDDSMASNFAFQIVNHNSVYDGTSLSCTITNLELTKSNGDVIELVEDGPDFFELTINDQVTDYIYYDLKKYNLNTAVLEDSILKASIEISDYYVDKSSKIASLEQSWGNPRINRDMILAIKKAGFDTVRVPVTYFNHISSDGTIDSEFLDRIEEVVDWVLDCGLYCIIDVHHDSGNDGWIKASADNFDHNSEMVAYIFRQIAERFRDKDHHLILEGLNEVVNEKTQWSNIPANDLQVMNKWNQLFVDTVRATGGNNKDRFLLVNTYAALPLDECLKSFVIPSDYAKNRIFVGVHCYPKMENINNTFAVLKKYSSKYHMVIGEWGFDRSVADRLSTIKFFLSEVKKSNIPAIYWDNGDLNTMGLFDRKECDWYFDDIVGAIIGK